MRRKQRRRRRFAIGAAAIAIGAGVVVLLGLPGKVDNLIQEFTLPLRHEDVIRQEARQWEVDPALVAAVIYAESRFRDQTSSAGARGLMQITPRTANEIEHKSGGTTFDTDDLANPDVNIAYGTFYLRYLLDQLDENEIAALAAYNAGLSNVNKWGGSGLTLDDIRFEETRGYVAQVLDKQDAYRDEYEKELGYGR